MSLFQPINLQQWIEDHKEELKPPIGNKQIWRDERGTIVMVIGGPNARKDYHVNPTEELFYQIQGNIAVGIIHPDTGKQEEIIIREGEIYLLPANVPHSPRRPKNTVGLVVELPRPDGATDKLQWYDDDTAELVYEAEFRLENIEVDLKRIMEEFWSNDEYKSRVAPPTEAQPIS